MDSTQRKQKGGSVVSTIITLAIIGIGAYIGIQYVPQHIESSTMDSILHEIELDNKRAPVTSVNELQRSIENQLNVNEMNDMRDSFEITKNGRGHYFVKVSYERELDLIYGKKQMQYEKTITLR